MQRLSGTSELELAVKMATNRIGALAARRRQQAARKLDLCARSSESATIVSRYRRDSRGYDPARLKVWHGSKPAHSTRSSAYPPI